MKRKPEKQLNVPIGYKKNEIIYFATEYMKSVGYKVHSAKMLKKDSNSKHYDMVCVSYIKYGTIYDCFFEVKKKNLILNPIVSEIKEQDK